MNDLRYANVLAFCLDHPWAITRPMLRTIAGIVARRVAGERASAEEIEAAVAARRENLPKPARGGVAIVPVYGVMMPRANAMSDMSGGTSYGRLTSQIREAAANPDVRTLVLDIDSPGGSVAGISELAREVLATRTRKPVIASINYTGCSSAYWLASACTEIVAAPSASLGNIGVYAIHEDISEALAQAGIKQTWISEGKYKIEGNETEPLTEVAAAAIKARVREHYDRFVTDVAAGRGVKPSAVRGGYGEGRPVGSDEALSLGMIDRIATLDETLARLSTAASRGDAAAAAPPAHIAATDPALAASAPPLDALWSNAITGELMTLQIQ